MVALDYGNGIVAGGTSRDPVRLIEHDGLEGPDIELAALENSILDGGRFGGSRSKSRLMVTLIEFANGMTRAQVQAAFTPGVLRVLSTPRASIPYYVAIAPQFTTSNLTGRPQARVTMWSPLAYPRGPLASAGGGTDPQWAYDVTTFNAGLNPFSLTSLPKHSTYNTYSAGERFLVASGKRLTAAGLWLRTTIGTAAATIDVYKLDGSNQPGPLIGSNSVAVTTSWAWYSAPVDTIMAGDTNVLVRVTTASTSVQIGRTSDGTAAPLGTGMYRNAFGVWADGDGSDASVDFGHRYTVGTTAATTTTAYVTPATEVPCFPKVTITLGANTSALTVTDGTHTMTITGAMVAGDVVVINSEPPKLLTVNGTNRFSWFDKAGHFPMLYPDTAKIEVNVASTILVEWQPRLMGLL